MGAAPSKHMRVLEKAIEILSEQENNLPVETYNASMEWLVGALKKEKRSNDWANGGFTDPHVSGDFAEEASERRENTNNTAPALAMKMVKAAEALLEATAEAVAEASSTG